MKNNLSDQLVLKINSSRWHTNPATYKFSCRNLSFDMVLWRHFDFFTYQRYIFNRPYLLNQNIYHKLNLINLLIRSHSIFEFSIYGDSVRSYTLDSVSSDITHIFIAIKVKLYLSKYIVNRCCILSFEQPNLGLKLMDEMITHIYYIKYYHYAHTRILSCKNYTGE